MILLNRPDLIDKLIYILITHFKHLPHPLRDKNNFLIWENLGIHITNAHFYQPIPSVSDLKESVFSDLDPLLGINADIDAQYERISNLVYKYCSEFNSFPIHKTENYQEGDFYVMNNNFTSVDSEIYYSIIREYKPKNIIEIGSGFSSFLALKAIDKNLEVDSFHTELTCIEPYPREFFKSGITGKGILIEEEVQKVSLEAFRILEENDILFIDSSHVAKIGSDVCFEFFRILPNLNKGVLIHFHDIFFPKNYPEHWIKEKHYFWNEQYVLQAFLMYNSDFEIFISNSLIQHTSPEILNQINSYEDKQMPGSIWLRKIR